MNLYEKIRILLSRAGLSEHEIMFYLTAIKNPYSSIYDLAKKAKLSKNKAYEIFNLLKDLELLSYVPSKGIIIPSSFNKLIETLEKKSRQLYRVADSLNQLNNVLPFLRNSKTHNNINVYDSIDEIRENYIDILDLDWENTFAYGSFEMFVKEIDPEIESKFIKNRVKKGRKGTAILTDNGPFTQELIKRDENELRKTAFLKNKKITDKWFHAFPNNNLVIIWSRDPKTGIFSSTAIENREVADFHKALFEADWKEANS